jgi:hypothetical protein
MTRLTALQWEYEKSLSDGRGNSKQLVSDMLTEYST